MLKSFLILVILHSLAVASEQLLVILAKDHTSTRGKLYAFEDNKEAFASFIVELGSGGLGGGVGLDSLLANAGAQKSEGDGKAPIGLFDLSAIFGYEASFRSKMPYIYALADLLCIDDVASPNYNKILKYSGEELGSFELMRRDDHQYRLGVVVDHNKEGLKGRGSCIFLHIKKSENSPTAGCSAMSYEQMRQVVLWLDKTKNPKLLQISTDEIELAKKLYPNLPLWTYDLVQ